MSSAGLPAAGLPRPVVAELVGTVQLASEQKALAAGTAAPLLVLAAAAGLGKDSLVVQACYMSLGRNLRHLGCGGCAVQAQLRLRLHVCLALPVGNPGVQGLPSMNPAPPSPAGWSRCSRRARAC